VGGFFDAASDELTALRGRPESSSGCVWLSSACATFMRTTLCEPFGAGLAIRERVGRLSDELGLIVRLQCGRDRIG